MKSVFSHYFPTLLQSCGAFVGCLVCPQTPHCPARGFNMRGKEESAKEQELRAVRPGLGPFPWKTGCCCFLVWTSMCSGWNTSVCTAIWNPASRCLRGSLSLQWFSFFKLLWGCYWVTWLRSVSWLSPVPTALSKFVLCFVVVFRCLMVCNWGSQDKVWVRGKEPRLLWLCGAPVAWLCRTHLGSLSIHWSRVLSLCIGPTSFRFAEAKDLAFFFFLEKALLSQTLCSK